jgi:hypothetical protein
MVELQFNNTFGGTTARFVKPEPRERLTRLHQPQDNAVPSEPKIQQKDSTWPSW